MKRFVVFVLNLVDRNNSIEGSLKLSRSTGGLLLQENLANFCPVWKILLKSVTI